jgi:hypothetical protein
MAVVNAVRCYELLPGDLDSTVQSVLDILQAFNDEGSPEDTRNVEALVG